MRAYIPSYQLVSPATLVEALDLLAQSDGEWKAFAGGTDLMVLLEAGRLRHQKYISIWKLNELRGIAATDDFVKLGALTTYTEIQEHPVMQAEFPMLCQAARETGGIAIQNRGTLGGNIVNASPAADSPPALLAYDAELELISKEGSRRIPYAEFHQGYKQMDIRSDELLRAVYLPRSLHPAVHYYRKVGTRKAQAISKICFAGCAGITNGVVETFRVALGSVAPIPIRCRKTETLIQGQPIDTKAIAAAKKQLAAEIAPISDLRSTKEYRLQVSQNLLEDFLLRLKQS